MAICEKILIAGFSGSGKTSLLQILERSAPSEEWIFHDLDQVILKKHKFAHIETLVETHGWEKFRLWERQALEGWLKEDGKGVLALGGGSLSQMILDLYRPSRKIKFCHLYSSFEVCWERLQGQDTEPRPLVRLGKSELQRIFSQREALFSQIKWQIQNPKGEDLQKLASQFWDEVLRS